ncbi:MAG TPA: hypothetical protein VIY68_04585 [Steroidobacteraceae bacterium]
MNHLTEEQLIEYYYEESSRSTRIIHHLRECNSCAESYAELHSDLDAIESIPAPARAAGHGEQVWQSIRNFVPVYKQKQRGFPQRFGNLKALSFATACTLLIAVAFFAGRQWENYQRPPQIQTAGNSPTRQPIVLVVLGDHLGRSERFLVALRHGDSGDSTALVKAEAKDLLSANRLYRESAINSGDRAFAAALDRLERVLVETANEPDNASPARLAELQKELNTDGLLFEVRVLRSHVQDEEKEQQPAAVRTLGVLI